MTYHVQTEDKGLQSPLILTLVYHGGAILAARRTPYDDLIDEGFQESTLAERLARQHKLICAAIKAGRLKDLQRKSEPQPATTIEKSEAETAVLETSVTEDKPGDFNRDNLNQLSPLDLLPAPEIDVAAVSSSSSSDLLTPDHLPSVDQPLPSQSSTVRIAKSGIADFARAVDDTSCLPQLRFLDEQPLFAGEHVKLRVHIFDDTGNARKFAGATLRIKIIGTAFPPVQHQTNANGESIATFNLSLPAFKAGRAVLLVTASISGYELELRRIIKVQDVRK